MSNHVTTPVSPFQGAASARASDPLHNGTDRPLVPRELTPAQIKRGTSSPSSARKRTGRLPCTAPCNSRFDCNWSLIQQ